MRPLGSRLGGRLWPAPLLLAGALSACGKTAEPTPAGGAASGGKVTSGGTQSAAGGHAAGGASSGGADAATGGTGLDGSLQPTADCKQPTPVENCEGNLCRIEPGCFIMGAPPNEWGRGAVNSDQVQVTLTRPFWLGRTEVTRAEWDASGLPRPVLKQLNGESECLEGDCPQGNATFYEMLAYANRLSEQASLEPCYLLDGTACTGDINTNDYQCPAVRINADSPYECEGYRLPMEAEWEYAARAGTRTAFPSGPITPQQDSDCYFDAALDAIGWYCMNAKAQAQRVAQKPPNAWGLHDMHGNLTERVNDIYGSWGYLTGSYGDLTSPLTDPTGAQNRPADLTSSLEYPWRVSRGGTHRAPAMNANSSWRHSYSDSSSASTIGFRIARTILEPGSGGAGAK